MNDSWSDGAWNVSGDSWIDGGWNVSSDSWVDGGWNVSVDSWVDHGWNVSSDSWIDGGWNVSSNNWSDAKWDDDSWDDDSWDNYSWDNDTWTNYSWSNNKVNHVDKKQIDDEPHPINIKLARINCILVLILAVPLVLLSREYWYDNSIEWKKDLFACCLFFIWSLLGVIIPSWKNKFWHKVITFLLIVIEFLAIVNGIQKIGI